MLTKTTKIVAKDYVINLSSPLKFFKDDSIMLYFEVSEFGYAVDKSGKTRQVANPLFPEHAFLFVEKTILLKQ